MTIKKLKLFFFSLFLVLSFLVATQAVLAETSTGLNETAQEGYGALPEGDLSTMIGKIVGAGLAFLGTAFFILIIYGGYTWMFSMGNEQASGKAKDIIIAAIIGLVVVLAAYAITSYIGGIF